MPPHARRGEHRSTLEDKLAAQLKAAGAAYLYEPVVIPYTPAKPRKYKPDFVLPNGIVIEAKGHFVSEDRSKHKTVKAQHPDLDIRFVFARPKNLIGKKSTTTYAQWADSHGFQWSEAFIPSEWLREPVNEQSLAALRNLGLDI